MQKSMMKCEKNTNPMAAPAAAPAHRAGTAPQTALLMLLTFLFCFLCAAPAFAEEAEQKAVRVGCFPLNGFYNFSGENLVDGYGVDYTESVFDYAGLPYEYVTYSSWVEALDALSRSEIDMLAPAQHTAERDKLYTFDSFPIGTEYGALLTLSTNDTLVYEDFDTLNGLTVGVVPSLVFLDSFMGYEKRNNFEVELRHYKDTDALISAMNAGDVDAALVNLMVKTDAMKLLARFGAAPIYYMFSEESGSLCETINLAVDGLTSDNPELQNKLSGTYFSGFNETPFTKAELDYIADSEPLKVACVGSGAPFAYTDEESGEFTGFNCAMAEKAAKLAGLEVSVLEIPADADEQEFVREHNIDFITGVEADDKDIMEGERYSQNYITVYKYFIGRNGTVFDPDVPATVACLNASREQLDAWKTAYPNFEFVLYDSPEACIEAVHSGKADYHLNDRYSAASLLSAPRNMDLQAFPYEAVSTRLCFKVTQDGRDGRLLASILNKAIARTTEADREKLIDDFAEENRYKYTLADFAYRNRFQITIAGIFLMAAIVGLAMHLNAKKKVRQTIEENEIKLRNITNNIKGGVVVLDATKGMNITYANNGFLELIGCEREQLEKNGSYLAYVHPDDLGKIRQVIDRETGEFSMNLRVLKTDGSYIPTLFNCTAGEVKSGGRELYCVILDLTEQEKLTEQLQMDKRRTELILGCMDEVFYEVNLRDHHIATSGSFLEKFGWTLPERLPDLRKDFIAKTWETNGENLDKIAASTRELLEKKEVVSTIVKLKCKKDKRMVWCEIVQHPVMTKDGSIVSVIGFIRNVDNQVSERERLIEQAQRDPLTGLYNKESFEMMVSETLAEQPDKNHALVFVDLDHFKSLNDTLGHMEGDKAICEAADKLRIIFSNYDILARFGGDEFCIFVRDIPEKTIQRKLDWMIEKLRARYHGLKGDVKITCSCGVTTTSGRTVDYATLMERADQALYRAKENGRNQYIFFEE